MYFTERERERERERRKCGVHPRTRTGIKQIHTQETIRPDMNLHVCTRVSLDAARSTHAYHITYMHAYT